MGENSQNKAVGISRGGRTTKIHAIVDGLGNPVEFMLSCGNTHDSTDAIALLGKFDIFECNILGDKAYASKSIRSYIVEQGANYTIPPRNCDIEQWYCDWWTYKERHLIECFFQKLKWFRRIVTLYDKLDFSFLVFVLLASISILLK